MKLRSGTDLSRRFSKRIASFTPTNHPQSTTRPSTARSTRIAKQRSSSTTQRARRQNREIPSQPQRHLTEEQAADFQNDYAILPTEMWLSVLEHLDYVDLKKCMKISKAFQSLVAHSALDRALFRTCSLETVEMDTAPGTYIASDADLDGLSHIEDMPERRRHPMLMRHFCSCGGQLHCSTKELSIKSFITTYSSIRQEYVSDPAPTMLRLDQDRLYEQLSDDESDDPGEPQHPECYMRVNGVTIGDVLDLLSTASRSIQRFTVHFCGFRASCVVPCGVGLYDCGNEEHSRKIALCVRIVEISGNELLSESA